jgi:hypothetical protein
MCKDSKIITVNVSYIVLEHQLTILHNIKFNYCTKNKIMFIMLVLKCHHLWSINDENSIKSLHIKLIYNHMTYSWMKVWWRNCKKFLKKMILLFNVF